jgi:hypothetical protein
MRRKSGSAGPPQAPPELNREELERARRAREVALDDLAETKRRLSEAARQMAERERKLAEREDRLEARVRRIARKLEARRQRQHRLDALRGRFAERELVKGKQQRKESQLTREEARLARQKSYAERRPREHRARRADVVRREKDVRAR